MTVLQTTCRKIAQKVGLAGLAVFVFLVAPLIAWGRDWSLGNALIWATGVVLLLYTYETQEMRRQLVRQNEISVQPLVLATVESRPVDGARDRRGLQVVLRNIGRGPALFVRVDEFAVHRVAGTETELLLTIPPVDCIESGRDAACDVKFVAREAGKEVSRHQNFAANLHPNTASETYEVMIRYEDTDRREYWAKVQMGKAGIRLLDHGQERRV